jgi:phosphatidate cytidylyltransferase
MLAQRVATALVLLALVVPALFASVQWPFNAVTLALIGAAGWEWSRLNHAAPAPAVALGAALVLACAAAYAAGWTAHAPGAAWALAALVWLPCAAWALRAGPSHWPALPRALRWLVGLAALWLAWLALAQSRSIGINFILSALCLVWAADIAAYFGGRRFGRRKLAPTISPGKSWEGVYCGLAGALALALAWSTLETRVPTDGPSLYAQLFARFGLVPGLAAVAGLAGLSVVGDLVESLVKRAVGAKDSSGLLPGHGGVLDRIDALLPVLPLALALLAG